MAQDYTTLEAAGQEVRLSSPGKVYFPEHEGVGPFTKLDLAEFYLRCAEPTLVHLRERPTVLKRWRDGITGDFFFQKRVPASHPEWLQTVTLKFPSGRSATELVPNDAAHLVWATNLSNIDWNPHPVRRADLDHPDELRIDLDPGPGVPWSEVRHVALAVRELLDEQGIVAWPKTSGSKGMHVLVRLVPEWDFHRVRAAALAVAREVERRMPDRATAKWWKEERVGVFLDYNQNAKDKTTASAYSVRPVPGARVSTPLRWDEVADVEPDDLRLDTVPARLDAVGDAAGEIDAQPMRLDALLELGRVDIEERGLEDAPWPPQYAKQPGEPPRVQPSRARRAKD